MYHTCLSVTCDPAYSEILVAELAQANFEAFLENDQGFEAYAEGESFDRELTDQILKKYGAAANIAFSFTQIPKKNWNEAWEKNYEPIVVEGQCLIRASFHQPEKKYPYEIVITPKMSFGTGHHQTTYLMVKTMLTMDFHNRRVMDAGCGTAILSILASKRGAKEVEAFDIDAWSIENGNENTAVNDCTNIRIRQGTIREVGLTGTFDTILANINKNVLLDELKIYVTYLDPGGQVLLSGFFTEDIPELLDEAQRRGLQEVKRDERERWASLLLQSTRQ